MSIIKCAFTNIIPVIALFSISYGKNAENIFVFDRTCLDLKLRL